MSKYIKNSNDPCLYHILDKRKKRDPWNKTQLSLDEIELTDDFFKNIQGCFRWNKIRSAYFNDFINIERVKDLFIKWREQNEYLWLEAVDTNTNEVVTNFFCKCSKRGNDVYKHRMKEKFSFLENLDPIYFFLDTDKEKYSPMIFISPTIDPKKYTLNQAWEIISKELHIFETKLRQTYGTFVKFRVWESHESGYPHCHIVYYFHKKYFKVFNHKDKYRIVTKHKNKITKYWKMGNIDIQAVQDTHGAFKEVKKYITKTIWNKKGDLTNALICLFNKQMYHISLCDPFKKRLQYYKKHNITEWREQERILMAKLDKWGKKDFIGSIWGTQTYFQFYLKRGNLAEPSATTLVKELMHNCNIENVKFRFVGCISATDLKEFMPKMDNEWVLIGDPPPEFKYLIGFDTDLLELDRG